MRDAGHSAKLSDQVQGLAAAMDLVDVVVVTDVDVENVLRRWCWMRLVQMLWLWLV